MQQLTSITNLQKLKSVRFASFDDNGHQVADANGIQLSADQSNCVSFSGTGPDLSSPPAGSVFFTDIVGVAPSIGPVTITASGVQLGTGTPFSTQAQITVTLDPSLPGPPTNWQITDGTVVPQ